MAFGYFVIWLAVGAMIYALGTVFATATMRWEILSDAVPALAGLSLIAAGAVQFTHWKLSSLLRCRSPLGCAASCQMRETGFLLGCRQGATCCVCCIAPMILLLVLGMMNPIVIVCAAIAIAAEKLLPRPVLVTRLVGISVIVAGMVSLYGPYFVPGLGPLGFDLQKVIRAVAQTGTVPCQATASSCSQQHISKPA